MNDLKVIRQLVKLMVDHDLTEVDLEGDGEKIRLKRGTPAPGINPGGGQGVPMQYIMQPASTPAPGGTPSGAGAAPGGASGDGGDDADDDGPTLDSPMVGTFYTASSPDAEPFVKPGDAVTPDTVVCIIEAMKVFNEIKAEQSGTIAEVLIKSGDAVEFGQPLFRLR